MRLAELVLLVVEDDVDNLELLGAHFEGEGATVLAAGSIAAALAMTITREPDAVLSDLELPDGNGCDLLRQLRARGRRPTPAIALTGYSDAKWRQRAADCGFDRYAVKPFSFEQLTAWVSELIDRKSGLIEATCHAEADQAGTARPRR